jgi:hypothetical protein
MYQKNMYQKNPDGTYTRFTYRRNANGTYTRIPEKGRGAGALWFWPFLIIAVFISAAVKTIAHHPGTVLAVIAWTGAAFVVIGVLAVIGYLSREQR